MLHQVIVGEGRPVLILHGARLDHRHMMETVEPVMAPLQGWRRHYVDLPGHGLSPARDDIRSQDDLLAAVSAFVEAQFGDHPIALIGESRGANLARGLIHLRPKSATGAALIVPGGGPDADPARLPKHQVLEPDPTLRAELPPEELARFDGMMVVQSRQIVDKVRRSKIPALALRDGEQEARIGRAFDFSFDGQAGRRVFNGPSLIVAGRQDSTSGYLDAMDLMPHLSRATFAVLDCAGHGLAWERPELFNALMRDWLRRLERGG